MAPLCLDFFWLSVMQISPRNQTVNLAAQKIKAMI